MNLDGVTIVIQGRTNSECLKHYADRYGPSCIVSTWRDSPPDPLGMKMVLSDRPTDHGTQNSHLQIVSTLAGLEAAETPYIIKVRGDEYFSNLEYVAKEIKDTTKILTLPIFFRPHDVCPFHPSDHLMAASREKLLIVYRAALEKRLIDEWYCLYPETLLCVSYLEKVMKTKNLKKEFMHSHFDILDLERVKDYKICYNGGNITWYNNFTPGVDVGMSIINMIDL